MFFKLNKLKAATHWAEQSTQERERGNKTRIWTLYNDEEETICP